MNILSRIVQLNSQHNIHQLSHESGRQQFRQQEKKLNTENLLQWWILHIEWNRRKKKKQFKKLNQKNEWIKYERRIAPQLRTKKMETRTNPLKAHRVEKSVKRIEFGSIVVYFFLWCYCSSWTCVFAFDLLKKIILSRIDPVINHVPFDQSQNGNFKLLLLFLKLPECSAVAQTFF